MDRQERAVRNALDYSIETTAVLMNALDHLREANARLEAILLADQRADARGSRGTQQMMLKEAKG
jgi:hypothetical protein